MERIIECVPNFSEGRNPEVIDAIVAAIEKGGREEVCGKPGVIVLNVDPGYGTNRTVVTFVGSPEAVVEAAFEGVRTAGELIDMRKHEGTHPRSGATDVLPLIPISGISLEECAELARRLAEKIYDELGIPCYCYEAAAYKPMRKNLAVCRAGEYEALAEKIADPDRRPDFGPEEYTETAARCGAINVGARNFLIAVNFNLDTRSAELAHEIACDVREKGRPDQPGTLKGCKAIGWYIEEYGIAQVSMNITDIDTTPLHTAFEEVCRAAQARGLRVTGTEIIGLVPKRALIEAGLHFMGNTEGVSEEDLVKTAIDAMGLDDLKSFEARAKVIEYVIEDKSNNN
jgi:glutamate formiminotransferase/formiminotetrahydrofolate cyclodeaminase